MEKSETKMVNPKDLHEEEGDEKENHPLIITKVVEYLQPVMCRELLCKFPDNSAIGFNYSQSSIWSPLLPRNYASPSDLDSGSDSCTCRNLNFGEFHVTKKKMKKKKTMKKKTKKLMKLDRSSLKNDESPKIGCFHIPTKGWNGMLKAAAKHFKKSRKVRESVTDAKLLNLKY